MMSGLRILHRKLADRLDSKLGMDRWDVQEFLEGRRLFRAHHARVFPSGTISTLQMMIVRGNCRIGAPEWVLTSSGNDGIFKVR